MSMTDAIDPRRLTGACSMVSWSEWGLHGNVVELIRHWTLEKPPFVWVELPRRIVADWLDTHPRHARRLLDELVRNKVLERMAGAGQRGARYRLRDPRHWRRVPWRFESSRTDPEATPEIVLRRLDALCAPEAGNKTVLVARPGRAAVAVDARSQPPANSPLLRAPIAQLPDSLLRAGGAQQNGSAPSSRSSEPQGPTPTQRPDRDDEAPRGGEVSARVSGEREEAPPGPAPAWGPVALEGAAKAVANAIVLAGRGPLASKRLVQQLADTFAGAGLDQVAVIVERIEAAAADGQRVPALVEMACQLWEAGAPFLLSERTLAIGVDARLTELQVHRGVLYADFRRAAAEGDQQMAEMFSEQLNRCETEIAALEERSAVS